jgi:hypothetical protein
MLVFAALLLSSPVLAQPISAGFRTGLGVNSIVRTDTSGRWVAGPIVELRWGNGIAFGAEFLVRRAALGEQATLWRWELPGTVMYRFRTRPEPFVRAGISANRVFHVGGAEACGSGPSGEQFFCAGGIPIAELRHRGTPGLVAGGGFRFGIGRLRVQPEVRLTRWFDRNFGVRDSAVRSNLTQIDVLSGVLF